MIDAHRVQNGGVKIMNMNGILDNVVAKLVGFAVTKSGLEPTTGEKHRETSGMMIATVIADSALRINRAAKLTAPNHQGILQEATLL